VSTLPNEEIFERNYARIGNYTLLIKPQVRSIYERLLEVRHLPGDVIEFGAYQGALSFFLGMCLRDFGLRKKVWMLDSFEGLPETDLNLDGPFARGTMKASLDAVTRARGMLGLESIVEIRAGWFSDSIKRLPKDARFCLAHLDADLYASTRTALGYLLPRLVEGGAVVLDDCLFHGAQGVLRAVDEIMGAAHLHLGPKTQAFAYPRGDPLPEPPAPVWREFAGRRFDVARLLQQNGYVRMAEAEAAHIERCGQWYREYLDVLSRGRPSTDESHRIASMIGTFGGRSEEGG
jgi:hypothetical protein